MDVLLVTPSFTARPGDGAEAEAWQTHRALTHHGVSVRVACETTDAPDAHPGPLTSRRIAHLAKGADVVHTLDVQPLAPVLRGARRVGVPLVATSLAYQATCLWGDHTFPDGARCHRCTVAGLREDYRARDPATVGRRVPAHLARAVVARRTLTLAACDRVLVPSDAARHRLVQGGVPDRRLHVVPPLVDVDAAREHPPLPAAGELLFTGPLDHTEGATVLLEALERLPAAHATLAGEGPAAARLRALADERQLTGRVDFPGPLPPDRLDDLFERARAYVTPHLWDAPSPRRVIRAWAHGVPVVTSARGAPADLITHEVTGLLVPAGDPRALAEALRRVLTDDALAGRLRKAARQRALDFTPKRVLPELLEAYDGVRTQVSRA